MRITFGIRLKLLALFCGLTTCSACHPMYFVEPHSTPLFTKAGEVNAGVVHGTDGGGYVQASVAASDQLLVHGTFEINDHSSNQQSALSGGLGYYGKTGIINYAILGGAGFGYHKYFGYDTAVVGLYNLESDFLSGRWDFKRYYVQGVAGISDTVRSPFFSWLKSTLTEGISARIEYLDIYRLNTTTSYSYPDVPDLPDTRARRCLSFDIAIFQSVKVYFVKVYYQVAYQYETRIFDVVYAPALQLSFGAALDF